MTVRRKTFDWRKIHDGLAARLSWLGTTYEHDQARVQSILSLRSMALAATPVDRRAASLARLLVFRACNERYGIALSSVREIATLSRIAALPAAPPAILGIINWRGEFVTVFDTPILLGLVRAADSLHRYVIVLRNEKPRIALAADNLDGLAPFDPSQLQTVDRSSAKATSLIKGIIADTVLVLDEERLRICVEDLCTA